jgi:hypothetical protein
MNMMAKLLLEDIIFVSTGFVWKIELEINDNSKIKQNFIIGTCHVLQISF